MFASGPLRYYGRISETVHDSTRLRGHVVVLRHPCSLAGLGLYSRPTGYLALGLALGLGAAISVGRLWGDEFLGRADLAAHVRFALSASRELGAGRWLLMFLNDAPVGFQPFFLYYSVVPAYLAGVFKLAFGVSAYEAVLLTFAAFFVIAGVGVALVCRYLRVGLLPTTVAACAYAFSPYAFDNFFARGALPEFAANALLPVALWAYLRCYATRGRRGFVSAVVATVAIVLTDKIQLPWFLTAFGLLVLVVGLQPGASMRHRIRRILVRAVSLAGSLFVGLALSAPYWLEGYLAVPHLLIAKFIGSYYEGLTQGLRIFWPVFQEAPGASGTTLALQLGAPAVIGILVGFGFFRRRLPLAMGLVGLASASMVAAGPWVWRLLPSILVAVQFPYRLLAQTTLFGVLGLALGMRYAGPRWPAARPRAGIAVAAVLVVLFTAMQFAHPLPEAPNPPATLFEDDTRIESVLHIEYVQFPDDVIAAVLASPTSGFQPEFADVEAHIRERFYGHVQDAERNVLVQRDQVDMAGSTARAVIVASTANEYVLPVQFSPYLRITETDERDQSLATLAESNVDGKAAVNLDSGMHRLQLDREMAPLAVALFGAGWLGLVVVLLAGWRRGSRAHPRSAA